MAEEEVEILRMGHQGEGVAERTPPLFVPYTLPGERVRVATDESDHGSLKGILTPSPERIKPACTHFTRCGGCALQHWQEEAYASWKEGLVAQAFSQQGISAEISPIVRAKPHTRRRASFAVTRTKSGAVAGYYTRGTHQIVPVSMCPLVRPEIESAMQPLADLVAGGLSRKGRASVLVDDRWGFIDADGQTSVEPRWGQVFQFSEGRAGFDAAESGAPVGVGAGLVGGAALVGAAEDRLVGQDAAARRLHAAVLAALHNKRTRTRDLGGKLNTAEFTGAVIANLGE